LAETLMVDAAKVDQEQLVRSISLVTNIDRIADSLDQSSPALTEIMPNERVAGGSAAKQKKKLRNVVRLRMKKFFRKYR
jgi:carbonic anhydrase/acetyltransferase-like protein (isoleucine patch superfamily)